jgi:hypothetical protein
MQALVGDLDILRRRQNRLSRPRWSLKIIVVDDLGRHISVVGVLWPGVIDFSESISINREFLLTRMLIFPVVNYCRRADPFALFFIEGGGIAGIPPFSR